MEVEITVKVVAKSPRDQLQALLCVDCDVLAVLEEIPPFSTLSLVKPCAEEHHIRLESENLLEIRHRIGEMLNNFESSHHFCGDCLTEVESVGEEIFGIRIIVVKVEAIVTAEACEQTSATTEVDTNVVRRDSLPPCQGESQVEGIKQSRNQSDIPIPLSLAIAFP